MYTLYYSPGACSMAVHICLIELGADFKAQKVDLSKGEHKTPEYLKINPRGQVGSLQTPDGVMSENAAMIIYLNDNHGCKLIPESGFVRARALQWLMFANSSLHPAYGKIKFAQMNELGDEAVAIARSGFQAKWDEIEEELARTGQPFLAGDQVTAADIYVAVCANWSPPDHMPKFGPRTENLLKSVVARPAYQQAIAEEQIEYKAVAA